jgi:hypothetical protein
MEPALAKAALELSGALGALDGQGGRIVGAFAWIMALALAADISSRILKPAKAEEDPVQVVLSQPVGAQAAVRRREDAKPATAKPKMLRPPATRLPRPTLRPPNTRPLKFIGDNPSHDRQAHGKKAAEKKMTPKPPNRKDDDDAPAECFSGAPTMRGCVVAEIDYLRNASCGDITALKASFGTIHVPKGNYEEAMNAIASKGILAADVLAPAASGSPDGEIYECIAAASAHEAILLTDSANIRRICRKRGIPCWSSNEWRMVKPAPA